MIVSIIFAAYSQTSLDSDSYHPDLCPHHSVTVAIMEDFRTITVIIALPPTASLTTIFRYVLLNVIHTQLIQLLH